MRSVPTQVVKDTWGMVGVHALRVRVRRRDGALQVGPKDHPLAASSDPSQIFLCAPVRIASGRAKDT